MKILITGANGTIGTRLCEKLIDQGHSVVGIDRVDNNFKPKKEVSFVKKIDLLNKDKLAKLEGDFDICVHLAANPYVRKSVENPGIAFENCQTTFNVLEYCRNNNIKKVFLASSREVYGNQNKIKKVEGDVFLDGCESPYTASKFYLEALGNSYNNCYDMKVVSVRFSNVYGMYDDSDRLIPTLIKKVIDGETIEIYGRDKSLDFTYIDDAVSGLIGLFEIEDLISPINISSGKQTSLLNVAEFICSIMVKNDTKIIVTNAFKGEVLQYCADITKLKSYTNHETKFDIIRGLSRTIDFYEDYFKVKK